MKNYRAEFFQDGNDKYWTVFLEYDPVVGKSLKNETESLDHGQKLLLERLKAWRKEKAENEGVPVYIVRTNKEFSDIVRISPKNLEALKNIKGFGKSNISKFFYIITKCYGLNFLILRSFNTL